MKLDFLTVVTFCLFTIDGISIPWGLPYLLHFTAMLSLGCLMGKYIFFKEMYKKYWGEE